MKRITAALTVWALLPGGAFAADAPPVCPTPVPVRQVVEQALSATCLACWRGTGTAAAEAPDALRLDWILPAGDDAALAVAALPEAAERWRADAVPADRPASRVHALPADPGAQLTVRSGLAWNGYVALSFELTPHAGAPAWPADARGWVALVERVPAGSDGTSEPRQLVRALVGPLLLQRPHGQASLLDVNAVRMPANSQPERLGAVGWVERADGQMLLAAESPRVACVDAP